MPKIRVLEIISGFAVEGPLGGIERFGISLAQNLNRERFEPILCGLWAYGTPYEHQWVERLRAQGIEAYIAADWLPHSPYQSFRNTLPALQRHREAPVDIIHSHCQFGDAAAIWLKYRYLPSAHLIRTVHNEREWGKRPLRRLLLTNFLYPILFATEWGVAQQVVDNLDNRPLARFLKRKARLVYNALDLKRFEQISTPPETTRQELGLTQATPIIGTVGRLAPQKGYEYLLRAVPQVVAQFPQAHFVIVGDGELREQLPQLAQDLDIAKHVLFTGPRSDIEAIIASFDLFVNSSLWEGLPTVLMESMAARIPVIATTVAGNLELVIPDQTGILIPPADPAALAQAILRLLQTESVILDTMTDQAYQHIQQRFSITAVARLHEQYYQSILDE